MDISKWISWIKLPTRTLAGLCIVSAVLLFLDETALNAIGAKGFAAKYRAYLGLGFLVTLALTLVNWIAATWDFLYPYIAEAHQIRHGKKALKQLTPEEKKLLSGYIHNQTRSQTLKVQSGVVNALVMQKILVRASSLGSVFGGFDYNIQPWAWEYLNENPELLD